MGRLCWGRWPKPVLPCPGFSLSQAVPGVCLTEVPVAPGTGERTPGRRVCAQGGPHFLLQPIFPLKHPLALPYHPRPHQTTLCGHGVSPVVFLAPSLSLLLPQLPGHQELLVSWRGHDLSCFRAFASALFAWTPSFVWLMPGSCLLFSQDVPKECFPEHLVYVISLLPPSSPPSLPHSPCSHAPAISKTPCPIPLPGLLSMVTMITLD